MQELDKYLMINNCETIEELQQAIIEIGKDNNDQIKGRSSLFSTENQSRFAKEIIEDREDKISINFLTRSYGIRQQALYIRYYHQAREKNESKLVDYLKSNLLVNNQSDLG